MAIAGPPLGSAGSKRLRGRRSSQSSSGAEGDKGNGEPKEDLALISKLRNQTKNPYVYAITIGTYPNGLRVQGPVRPTPALARADRARMEALRADLEDEGKSPQDIAERMRALAKEIKLEAKQAKPPTRTREEKNARQREKYARMVQERTQGTQATEEASTQQSEEGEGADVPQAKKQRSTSAPPPERHAQ